MDLNTAMQKHSEWRMKLRAAIGSKETMDVAAISKDNACEFGKWLHGEAKAAYQKLPGYSKCVSSHAAFHVEAGRVASLINAKKYR